MRFVELETFYQCGRCGVSKPLAEYGRKEVGLGWVLGSRGVSVAGGQPLESLETPYRGSLRSGFGKYCLECLEGRGLEGGGCEGFSGNKLMRARDTEKRGGWGLGVKGGSDARNGKGLATGLGVYIGGKPWHGAKVEGFGEKLHGLGGVGDSPDDVDLDFTNGKRGSKLGVLICELREEDRVKIAARHVAKRKLARAKREGRVLISECEECGFESGVYSPHFYDSEVRAMIRWLCCDCHFWLH